MSKETGSTQQMRHVVKAWEKMFAELNDEKGIFPKTMDFITIANHQDVKGVPPVVSFKIQSDPIKEVGVNGCQAEDILRYVKCLFQSLNEAFGSPYNEETIQYIDLALAAQQKRTADRLARGVEGENKD